MLYSILCIVILDSLQYVCMYVTFNTSEDTTAHNNHNNNDDNNEII